MTARTSHTFQFKASQIAEAAEAEAKYHDERAAHWTDRRDKALETVERTIGAKVIKQTGTGGVPTVGVAVDYGDSEAWQEYQLAHSKAESHKTAAERYRTDQRVYSTQGDKVYELDTEDVHHFRLGGQPRED